MKAKITLKDADFSANNIGQLVDPSPLTLAVLTKQTQYGPNSDEARALNAFLNRLENDGFLGENGSIKTLIIPALASQQSELMYNIALLDSNGYPTNEMSAEEIAAATKCYVPLISGTRVIGLESTTYQGDGIDSSVIGAQKAFEPHILTIQELIPSHSVITFIPQSSGNLSTEIAGRASNTVLKYLKAKAAITFGNASCSEASIESLGVGFAGFSYNATSKEFSGLLANGILGTTVIGETAQGTVNSTKMRMGTTNPLDGVVTSRTSLLIFANTDYTNLQLTTLKGYVDTLMTALHVTQ